MKNNGETSMKRRHVVFTGGAGFIGSNLAHALAEGAFDYEIQFDLSTGLEVTIDWFQQ